VVSGHALVRVQAAEQVKTGLGAMHHGGGHGQVEPRHRRWLDGFRYPVEREYLPPVGIGGPRSLTMDGRDRGR
jgi:hypothetical protein